MRTGGVPATLLLVLASALLQVSTAGDIYWEGEEDALNEYLEVKTDDESAVSRHLKRLKRDWLDPLSFWSSNKDDTDDKDDDADNLGSGSPDKIDPEPVEKTLRVTFVVMEPYRTPEYSNRDSPEFQNFSRSLANAVDALFEQLPGTQKSSLVRIQSLITDDFYSNVTLDIVTTGYDDTDRIIEVLQNHIKQNRRLGSIPVQDEHFKAQLIDPALSYNYDTNTSPNTNAPYGNNYQNNIDRTRGDGDGDTRYGGNDDGRGDQTGFNNYDNNQNGDDDNGYGDNNVDSTTASSYSSGYGGNGYDDNQTGDNQGNDNQTDDNQTDDNQTDDNQTDDNQTDDNQTDDNQTDDNQTNDNQTDDNQTDDNQTDDNQTDDNQTDDNQRGDGGYGYNTTSNTYESNDREQTNDNGYTDSQTVDYGAGDNNVDSTTDRSYQTGYPRNGADATDDNDFDNNNIDQTNTNSWNDNNEVDNDYQPATTPATSGCEKSIQCAGSSVMICPEQRCDNVPDCPYRDDEDNCDERGDTDGQRESSPWDRVTTTVSPTGDCAPDFFQCDETRCVSNKQRCDGRSDCYDRTDEYGCPEKTCGSDDFRCGNDQCIESSRQCDGVHDCADGSDEINCACTQDEFQCVNDRSCIEGRKRCDGERNCPDGSDEDNCNDVSCPPDQITCNGGYTRCGVRCNDIEECDGGEDEADCEKDCSIICGDGTCIPNNKICDRRRDCPDGADEASCFFCDGPNDFSCKSGECLSSLVKCNGLQDCEDNSDELDCNTTMVATTEVCNEYQFKCNSTNVCIQDIFYCDGNEDCLDGSDEANCPCSEFQCESGGCILNALICDGKEDCNDGSDENDCDNVLPSDVSSKAETPVYTTPSSVYSGNFQTPNYPRYPQETDEQLGGSSLSGEQSGNRGPYGGYPGGNAPSSGRPGDRGPYGGYPEGNGPSGGQPGDRRPYGGYPEGNGPSGGQPADRRPYGGYPEGNGPSGGQPGDRSPYGGYPEGNGPTGGQPGDRRPNGDYPGSNAPSGGQQPGDRGTYGGYPEGNGPSGGQSTDRESNEGYPRSDVSSEGQSGNRGPYGGSNPSGVQYGGYPRVYKSSREEGYPGGSGASGGQAGGQGQDGGYPGGNAPSGGQNAGGSGSSGGQYGGYPGSNGPSGGQSGDRGYPESGGSSGGQYGGYPGSNDPSDRQSGNRRPYPVDFDSTGGQGGAAALLLRSYPIEEYVRNGGDVVLRCRDEGPLRAPVRWVREGGRPIRRGSTDINGRLEMMTVSPSDAGVYICQAPSYLGRPEAEVKVTLNVITEQAVTNHPFYHCRPDQATCGNGECIPKSAVCDKNFDCSDRSDEESCHQDGMCEPNQFKCDNGKCVLKNWICDSDRDCGSDDDSDERNCDPKPPGSQCSTAEFTCSSDNMCIPKSYHCDNQNDCSDGSDEIGCMRIHITQAPTPSNVVLNPGDTLILTCRAVGVPVPLITWRRNWGHVPPQCISTSVDGVGTLKCTDMQTEHNGAYSCEAISIMGTNFATPDAIVIVNNTGLCPRGYFNNDARSESECIRCFCFGKSTQCRSADLFTYNMPTALGDGGTRLRGIKLTPSGGVELDTQSINDQYYYEALRNGATVTKLDRRSWSSYDSHPYLSLPETYNGNQLTSYGGHIKYTLAPQTKYAGIDNTAPTIIIKGKYRTLVHKTRASGSNSITIEARLTPEDWTKSGPEGLEPAAREDIMMALDDVEMILLRADYNNAGVNITDFVMESAQHINVGLGAASLVEECTCPKGYEGLSCQKCATGYVRKVTGPWLGECVAEECPAGTYGNPSVGMPCRPCPCPLTNPENQFASSCSLKPDGNIQCDCLPGYEGHRCEYCASGYIGNPGIPGDRCERKPSNNCNPTGTKTVRPPDECVCKDNVQGRYCDTCKNETFYLSTDFRHGCAQCFCSAVSGQCKSSNLRRKTISAQFNVPQIVEQLKVYNSAPSGDNIAVRYMAPVETQLRPQLSRGDVYLEAVDRSSQSVYYWSLPESFAGDKVTAYGGYFHYTLKNVPTSVDPRFKNNAADIQLISDNQYIFQYVGKFQPSQDGILNVTIQLLEKGWQRPDGEEIPREFFLLALADVKTILIKATYSNDFQVATPVSASIEVAAPDGNGPMAVHVESCTCPAGYIGTSCEDCAPGYTRSTGGIYLMLCKSCECNGKSNMCNPETGVCYDCAGNTQGDQCEFCKPGYEKDANGECVSDRAPQQCQCDPRGTSGPCDSYGNCYCKQNVEGESCDRCRPGTFGLDTRNPAGCLSCYCSGVTSDCHEANHYTMTLLPAPMIFDNYGGYTITDLQGDKIIKDNFVPQPGESELMYIFQYGPDTELYWSIPVLPGNRVLSYGGSISLRQMFVSNEYDVSEPGTDVILEGDNLSVFWTNPNKFNSDVPYNYQIPLSEAGWYIQGTSTPASRSNFMNVLRNLKRVLVRATLVPDLYSTSIADVSMDIAVPTNEPDLQVAKGIEVCMCPPGYSGTSCESCQANYYHDRQGYCQPCPCNGHGCKLDAYGQVVCTCEPPYKGPDCSTVGGDSSVLEPTTRSPVPQSMVSVTIVSPKLEIREVGGSVNFTCQAVSLNTRAHLPVQWSKSGGYLPQGRSYVDQNSGLLMITQLQVYDSGVYICESSDGVNTEQARATLQVPGNEMTLPVVEITPIMREYYEGEPIELECRVTAGNPAPTIRWHRGSNRPLPIGAQSYVNSLVIDSARVDDAGEYTCVAINPVGSAHRTAVINVRPRPSRPVPEKLSVSNTSPKLDEGQSITIVCTGSANVPAESIDWSRQDRDIQANVRSENGVLYINNAVPGNQGVYICKSIDGEVAPVQVLVTVVALGPPSAAPDITVSKDHLQIPTGGSASLECNPEGLPLPSIKWRKHEGEFGSGVSQRGNSLIISSAQESDGGYYICEGSVAGNMFKNFYVYVEIERRIKPVVEVWPEGEQAVTLGGEFTLWCRVIEGTPEPIVVWSRSGGRPLSAFTQMQPQNKLSFEKIDVNDEGEYICTASNLAGEASASATIKVRSAPEITITPNNYLQVVQGDPINIECRGEGNPIPMVSIKSLRDYREVVPPSPGFAALRVRSAGPNDDGEYVCTATSIAGTIDEQISVAVDRGDGGDDGYDNGFPDDGGSGEEEIGTDSRPYEEPANIIVYDNQTQTYIDCNTTAKVEWTRPGQPLQKNAVQYNSRLFIYNVSKSDSGDYVCNILNSYNEVVSAAYTRLRVVSPPRINLYPRQRTVRPGESPTVECIVDGDEIIRVSWRPVGRPLSRRVDTRSSILIFHQIEVEDAGMYECFAESRYGNTSSDVEVIVSEDTDRSSSVSHANEQFAHAGSAVHLSCNVTHANVRIVWTKDGRGLPRSVRRKNDGSLYIRLAQQSDSGRYVCSIRDPQGRVLTSNYINLHIEGSYEPQKLASINKPQGPFRTGDNVQVTCSTIGRDTRAEWQRPGTNQYVASHAYGDGAILEIQGVTSNDAGVYRCVATDNLGRTSFEDFNLVIEPGNSGAVYPYGNGEVSQYSARLQSSVDLPCNHNLELPVYIEWRREFSQLPPDVRANQPVLRLDSVTESDAGTYVCRVSNGRVTVEAKAILIVTDVVPMFQGDGFLSLPPLKDAFKQFKIEISIKPSYENGLILYNSELQGRNGDYIALQLKEGVPEFIIKTDEATGPLTLRGDRPLQLNSWHTIRLSRVNSKLNMDVDNTGTSLAESEELRWGVLDLYQPLYIGGVPDYNQLPETLSGATGYMGCVSMLLLRDKETNIMTDSLDRERVSQCNSCTPNLCYNNGVCQEALNERGYSCICPSGFAGLNCDRTGEACRPGLCGPGKCTDTDNGYKCACPVTHTGNNCEVKQQIEYPAFSGSTYFAINAPNNARTFKMSMNIKAAAPVTDGIIMYCAESARGYGGFTSLAVHNGKLEFRYDAGGGSTPVVFSSKKNLPENEWTTVQIGRVGTLVSLKINQTRSVENYEKELDSPKQILNLNTPIYVGSVEEATILNNNTGVVGGFSGCIKELTLNGGAVDIMNDTIKSENVQECNNIVPRGDIPESENKCRCRNGGTCTTDTTTCVCPYGYTGTLCEQRVPSYILSSRQPYGDPCTLQPCRNGGTCRTDRSSKTRYTCDCGLGYAGANCQMTLDLLQSVGFNGNGYLELPAKLLHYELLNREPVIIAMAILTSEKDGVLLYQKEAQSLYSDYGDYILIRVENGVAVVEWDMGGGKSSVSLSSVYISDGERHQIIFKLEKDGRGTLTVDEDQITESTTGFLSTMNADSNVYIGGIPDNMNTQQYPGFNGCIEQVELMESKRGINLGSVAVAGLNTQRCKDSSRYY